MAQIIKSNGQTTEVTPKNGTDFSLEELQTIVGGWIEIVNLRDGRLLCLDEEGKLKGKERNHVATDIYRQAMVNSHDLFDRFIGQHYSYATFDNGLPIDNFHRRLYHGLTLQGETIPAPFTTGKGTYYDRLRKKNLLTKQRFDNLNRRNIEGLDRKRRLIGLLFGTLYRLMGYRRYAMFVKSLYHYCRPELHTFLIKK